MEDIRKLDSVPKIDLDISVGWDIGPNYHFITIIGYGSYGTVCKARSLKTGTLVAIKKFLNIFSNSLRCKRVLREVELLYEINHPCIIRPLDVFMRQAVDLYLVMEICESDVSYLRNSIFLINEQVRAIMYKLLAALNYIHSGGIINRDVKPANILINTDCSIKLCDFSLSRCISGLTSTIALPTYKSTKPEFYGDDDLLDEVDEGYKSAPQTVHCKFEVHFHKTKQIKMPPIGPKAIGETMLVFLQPKDKKDSLMPMQKENTKEQQLSGYVATRWYRPPEVILLEKAYTTSVDVWGAGCVFAELLEMVKENLTNIDKRSALFPGESCFPLSPALIFDTNIMVPNTPQDQLKTILKLIGKPTASDLAFLQDNNKEEYVNSLAGSGPKVNFKDKFPAANEQALDLLKGMLEFNPFNRISTKDALKHAYFADIRDKTLEVEMIKPVILLTDILKDVGLQTLANKVIQKVSTIK